MFITFEVESGLLPDDTEIWFVSITHIMCLCFTESQLITFDGILFLFFKYFQWTHLVNGNAWKFGSSLVYIWWNCSLGKLNNPYDKLLLICGFIAVSIKICTLLQKVMVGIFMKAQAQDLNNGGIPIGAS